MNTVTKHEIENHFRGDNTNGLYSQEQLDSMNDELMGLLEADEFGYYDAQDVACYAEQILEKN